ncbi:MAG: hypothetical protein LC105_11065 [Chitinophagales bacterium]|nr:hypothetical protein [Chitinophagales bacterium]MCZ2394390.1 hypothetical protein [Chitinophagales bacterium]
MKKSTISLIILSSLLVIASVSAVWTYFLKNKISDIRHENSSDTKPIATAPDTEKILDWILNHQMDSLNLAVKQLKKDNPHLSKKINQYIKNHKVTKTGIFVKIEDIVKKEIEKEQPVVKSEEINTKDEKTVIKVNEPDVQLAEYKSESNKKDESHLKYLRFKIGKNNVYYTGDIVNGKADGNGKGVFDNGWVYEGQWTNNAKQGKGKEKFTDGSYYEGDFENNMRSGFGTYVSKYNEKYIGQWENDMQQGEGTLYDKKGKVKYKGEWKANIFIN